MVERKINLKGGEELKIGDIKIYEITPEALDYYRKNTKGNQYKPEGVVVLKLSRNIHLAHKEKKLSETIYTYGNLRIVTRLGKIIELSNSRDNKIEGWKEDKEEYNRISKLLGIRDNKFKNYNR